MKNTHPADTIHAAATSSRAATEHIRAAMRHVRAALDLLTADDDHRMLWCSIIAALDDDSTREEAA